MRNLMTDCQAFRQMRKAAKKELKQKKQEELIKLLVWRNRSLHGIGFALWHVQCWLEVFSRKYRLPGQSAVPLSGLHSQA